MLRTLFPISNCQPNQNQFRLMKVFVSYIIKIDQLLLHVMVSGASDQTQLSLRLYLISETKYYSLLYHCTTSSTHLPNKFLEILHGYIFILIFFNPFQWAWLLK